MKKYGVWDSWTKHISLDLVDHFGGSAQRLLFQSLGVSYNGTVLLKSENLDTSTEKVYDTRSDSGMVQYICQEECVTYFAAYAESIFLS